MAQSRKLKKVTKHKRNTRKYSSRKTRKSKMQSGSGPRNFGVKKEENNSTSNDMEVSKPHHRKHKHKHHTNHIHTDSYYTLIKNQVCSLCRLYNITDFSQRLNTFNEKFKRFFDLIIVMVIDISNAILTCSDGWDDGPFDGLDDGVLDGHELGIIDGTVLGHPDGCIDGRIVGTVDG